jgi:hypothetical protein
MPLRGCQEKLGERRRRHEDEPGGRKILKHQVQARMAPVRSLALLGGYGSGKSTGGVDRFKAECAKNGVDRRRKDNLPVPKAAIVAPTYKNLMQGSMATFDAVFPPEWIKDERGNPEPYRELWNGVIVELHSGNTLESTNYFAVLVEEIQHAAYDDRQWANFSARVRDPDAISLTETYTGLPEEGRVRARFDRPPASRANDPAGGHWTILCATKDNTALKPEVLHAILASVPKSEAVKLIEGKWMLPVGALHPDFDSLVHVRPDAFGVPTQFIHVGIDPGPLGAVVLAQEIKIRALLPPGLAGFVRPDQLAYDDTALRVVGQILPENQGLEGICELILDRQPEWPIVRGMSKIFVDSTISTDDYRTIKRYFPGVSVIEADQYNGAAEDRIEGINRALRDSVGTVRLKFSPALSGAQRGVLEAMVGSKRNEKTGAIVADNWFEHARDALGYIVEGIIPAPYKHSGLQVTKPKRFERR